MVVSGEELAHGGVTPGFKLDLRELAARLQSASAAQSNRDTAIQGIGDLHWPVSLSDRGVDATIAVSR